MAITLDGTSGITASGSLTTSSNLTTGTGAIYNGLQTSTAVASTSGTNIDFTNIPSWVKRITIMFNGVTNATSITVRLGYGATPTYVATGYNGAYAQVSNGSPTQSSVSSTGFGINASTVVSGIMTISLLDSNVWVSSHTLSPNNTAVYLGSGSLSLGNTLTAVRIAGGGTFSAGTINISYE